MFKPAWLVSPAPLVEELFFQLAKPNLHKITKADDAIEYPVGGNDRKVPEVTTCHGLHRRFDRVVIETRCDVGRHQVLDA